MTRHRHTVLLRHLGLAAALGAVPLAAVAQLPALSDAPRAEAPAPAPTVEVESTPEEDRAIEERLEAIYATLGALEGVQVEVRSGVVRLTGEVLNEHGRQQAVTLARQLRGVVEVEEEIRRVRNLDRRLAAAWSTLRARGVALVAVLPLFAVALAIFVLALLLARLVGRWHALFRRLAGQRFLADILRQLARASVVLGGALVALEVLDATAMVTALAGAAGLAGLALGFALRDVVENYIASVLLSLRQPFRPHDHVVIEGHEGRVVRLTSRATVLMTLDGNSVRIPNADVFKGVILNYSRNPRRRFELSVGVATDADLAAALELGLATLRATAGILAEPPPEAWIDELGDRAVTLRFFAWIDQRGVDWSRARGEAIRRIKLAFDDAGVRMPEPLHIVRLEEGRSAPLSRVPAAGAAAAIGPAAADVSRDSHLDREVAAERATGDGEEDLLDAAAPIE